METKKRAPKKIHPIILIVIYSFFYFLLLDLIERPAFVFTFIALMVVGVCATCVETISQMRFKHAMKDPKRIAPFNLRDMSWETVTKQLKEQGFERVGGIECFSKIIRFKTLSRHRYSVGWVRAEQCTWYSLVNAVEAAVNEYDSQPRKVCGKNECLILFVEAEIVCAQTREMMEELSRELILDTENQWTTIIPVLIEGSTGQGCYWAPTINIGDYARGCGLLRKCLL